MEKTLKEQTPEDIQKSFERYRSLVEQSNEGIWRIEIDEAIDIRLPVAEQIDRMMNQAYLAECNQAMVRMYGFTEASELLGARLHQLWVPDNENNILFLKAFIANDYRLADQESVEHDKAGNIVHFRNTLLGIVEHGKLICAWGMQKDITEEVKIKNGLQRSEERLRMASQAGRVGIWEWNIGTNELFWSDWVKDIFEIPHDHMASMDIFRDAIHPDDREEIKRRIQNALDRTSTEPYESHHRIITNGKLKWVQGFGEAFFDSAGRPIRMSGTVVDVTPSKLQETKAIQLRDVGAALSRSMTLQEVSEVIVHHAIRTLNADSLAIFNRDKDPLVMELIHSHGYQDGLKAELNRVTVNHPSPFAKAGFLGKVLFQTQTGSSLAALPLILNERILGVIGLGFSKAQIFDEDLQRFMLTFADQCTQAWERARLYETERAARQEAEAANKAKTRFLANMSHEIRTPLSAIIGFAEFLNEEGVDAEEQKDCINRILRNSHMLGSMISDVLDLAKIESERMEVEDIDFELVPLVEEVFKLLSLKAQEKQITLSLIAEGALPKSVHSDPTRLRQILINLIGNAIKFTLHGKVDVRIRVEPQVDKKPRQLRFTIVDTGIGIAEEHQERIFEPFMQADTSTTRQFGGTGLGLVLSRSLAEALGGELKLTQSVVGEGSIFTFSINLGSKSQDLMQRQEEIHRPPNLHSKELAGLKVLLVDDNMDNRAFIGHFITAAGAQLETANNGIQAVDMATHQDYDIVLMDIQMPELDGFGAIRVLQSHSYDKPVLALTAHAMSGDREQSISAGFKDHLVKPIDRSSLIQAIKKYVHS